MMSTLGRRVLKVNLTTGHIEKELLPKSMLEEFVGGRGINVALLWKYCDADTDPLGPGNPLIFGTGLLNATCAPCASRWTVTCKSPATYGYLKSSCGGHFAPELKLAGYDYLVITGHAEKPVYIYVHDDDVIIRDAQHLWGMNTRQTDRSIKNELGSDYVEIAQIGPAGENLVKFAGIMTAIYRTAGRGGAGTVMGSKNLKAVAVRGTGEIEIADPQRYERVALSAREALRDDHYCWNRSFQFGTAQGVVGANLAHRFPHKNFQDGYMPDAYKLGGEYITENFLEHPEACSSCVLHCGRFSKIRDGKYAGTHTAGPEYETVSALGGRCDIADTAAVIKGNELVNLYGLDCISTGAAISFAMECFEEGILTKKETDGLDLRWGNAEAMLEMIRRIANREGLGDLLAHGVKYAAEKLGRGANAFAVQAKGLEQSEADVRARFSYALAFAVNPRGPDHLTSEVLMEAGYTPEVRELAARVSGVSAKEATNSQQVKGKANMVGWSEDIYAASDSLGICAFATTWSYTRVNFDNMAKMFEAATGIPLSPEGLQRDMQRVINLERCFNVREGFRREDDTLHQRMFNPPRVNPPAGDLLTKEKLAAMIDDYYTLRGWDIKTGIPHPATLADLGLDSYQSKLRGD